jgi:hypothetical protein
VPDDRLTITEATDVILSSAAELARRASPSNQVAGLAQARQLARAAERLLAEIGSLHEELDKQRTPAATAPDPTRTAAPSRRVRPAGTDPTEGGA